MRNRLRHSLTSLALLACASVVSAQVATVSVRVNETAGIRRSAFPATAVVPFPRGSVLPSTPMRLLLGGAEVPSQSTPVSFWPDGSVQRAEVDFNASPGPGESLVFLLEYGADVKAPAAGRGLNVSELGDAIQVGSVRFSRIGAPMIGSVKYRDEVITAGANGFFAIDANGAPIDLFSAADLELALIKRGPLVVSLRYSGALQVGTASVPFIVVAEMPSSKSWVKLTATVTDTGRQLRGIGLATPLALGPAPWVWDFGTPRWSYGQLRTAADAASFERQSGRPGLWRLTTRANGREQVAETGIQADAPFAGWWHVQGIKEVVAFAVPGLAGYAGGVKIDLEGSGQTRVAITPAGRVDAHQLTVYEHFVATPVQIGAATAPPAILAPLVVTVEP